MAKKAGDTQEGSPKKLRKLIKNIRIAMLTTVGPDGSLHSRPMRTSDVERDGILWFITKAASSKAGDVAENQAVNVTYADPKGECYVSLTGVARVVHDPQKVLDLWSGKHKAWFPEGKNDPDLALLQVNVRQAEYWDSASGRMVPVTEPASSQAEATPSSGSAEGTGAGAQG